MDLGPYAIALAGGTLSALNPCGFALLPAYLALLVAPDGTSGPVAAVGRAVRMSAAMTAGFVGVFALFAVVVVPLSLAVEQYLPWVTVVIGLVLVVLGTWLLAGRHLLLHIPTLGGAPARSFRSMVLYGVAYATASLSCTIGPFLAVATSTTRSSSLVAGAAVVVVYALGMGLVVGVLAVATALAREGLLGRMRRILPYVGRASGALLVVAGLYVAYYGWYELRILSGGATQDPVVDTALQVQSALARAVEQAGFWVLLGVAAGCWPSRSSGLGDSRDEDRRTRDAARRSVGSGRPGQ